MKRNTLEYQAQLKASVKQQEMAQQKKMQDEQAARNQAFMSDLFKKAEKERRET